MKKKIFVALFLVVFSCFNTPLTSGEPIKILYDDTHGQKAGNADWVITGAYSEMADLLKANDFTVISLSQVSPSKKFTVAIMSEYKAIILAEPNNPYDTNEQEAMVEFVKNGGGAFIIGDHGGADRDHDGWDAVKALNAFCGAFGFKFAGDFFYEAPVSGSMNKEHPVMFGVRGVGAWAASTFILSPTAEAQSVSLLESRRKKAPFIVASEVGKGRVVAIGDSSPFDDGTGSGGKKQLHDSYDSFIYSHPQLAYNAVTWITGRTLGKRIPSRIVAYANDAKMEEKAGNILIDAAHGNAASDKMETFEKHMNNLGFKVYYTLNLITPEVLKKFSVTMLPDPSLPILDAEATAIEEWFMAGGRLVVAGDWDSADLQGRETLNNLLEKLGSVIRLNDDQVWDDKNKTNKPWGVLARTLKQGHPIMEGVKTVISWGTCSLMARNRKPLVEEDGIEILISGNPSAINKDGNKKNDAFIYPAGTPIPIMGIERLCNGILVVIGCCNFTDYQYPDSDINAAKSGPCPFTHETPAMYDNLVKFLATPAKFRVLITPRPVRSEP